MTISQSVISYRSSTLTTLSTKPSATSLVLSNLFTRQTGAAFATELLYRILFDIVQRLLTSFQHLASKSIDQCTSWVEHKMQERHERLASAEDGLKIVDEVRNLAAQRAFIACPMATGTDVLGGGPQPPRWVKGVLEGIEEGRMEDKDFRIHTHTG